MTGAAGASARGLTAVPGVTVGHAHDRSARTGCTAVLGPFRAAVETRGLATGSRELGALSPLHVVPRCDAILLTGGSAFGLAAADGVVRWLEERGRGFETSAARVPIVPAAVVYDLAVGDASVRPGPEMGYAAAGEAADAPVDEGPVGAGCGATVGKLLGGGTGERAGVGTWADGLDGAAVAALAVVNAFGDVLDADGRIVAGARDEDGAPLDTARAVREGAVPPGFRRDGAAGENTTLGVVATDAPLSREELRVVARQAVNGLVRRVSPAGTLFDGDMVFAVSTAGAGGGAHAEPGRGGGHGAGRTDAGGSRTDAGADRVELLRLALRAQEVMERAVERAAAAGAAADGGAGDAESPDATGPGATTGGGGDEGGGP